MKIVGRLLVVGALIASVLALVAPAAGASTRLTSCGDAEFRAAVAAGGTITWSTDCNVQLVEEIVIPAGLDVTIDGGAAPGSSRVFLNARNLGRHFRVEGGTLRLRSITLFNGKVVGSAGNPGVSGGPGADGDPGSSGSVPTGALCPVAATARPGTANDGGPGTAGEDGRDGSGGAAGTDGGVASGGSLYIGSGTVEATSVTFLGTSAIGGAGGPGGSAGSGGAGGAGGAGGQGQAGLMDALGRKCLEGGTGGDGAAGGAGGDGGVGAKGGNGGAVRGGVIYNEGTLTLTDSTFPDTAGSVIRSGAGGRGGAAGAGGAGGPGGEGGPGGSGAGGDGGPGGWGAAAAGFGTRGGDGARGGEGGLGGDLEGGIIFNTGTVRISNPIQADSTSPTSSGDGGAAGDGGAGGAGGAGGRGSAGGFGAAKTKDGIANNKGGYGGPGGDGAPGGTGGAAGFGGQAGDARGGYIDNRGTLVATGARVSARVAGGRGGDGAGGGAGGTGGAGGSGGASGSPSRASAQGVAGAESGGAGAGGNGGLGGAAGANGNGGTGGSATGGFAAIADSATVTITGTTSAVVGTATGGRGGSGSSNGGPSSSIGGAGGPGGIAGDVPSGGDGSDNTDPNGSAGAGATAGAGSSGGAGGDAGPSVTGGDGGEAGSGTGGAFSVAVGGTLTMTDGSLSGGTVGGEGGTGGSVISGASGGVGGRGSGTANGGFGGRDTTGRASAGDGGASGSGGPGGRGGDAFAAGNAGRGGAARGGVVYSGGRTSLVRVVVSGQATGGPGGASAFQSGRGGTGGLGGAGAQGGKGGFGAGSGGRPGSAGNGGKGGNAGNSGAGGSGGEGGPASGGGFHAEATGWSLTNVSFVNSRATGGASFRGQPGNEGGFGGNGGSGGSGGEPGGGESGQAGGGGGNGGAGGNAGTAGRGGDTGAGGSGEGGGVYATIAPATYLGVSYSGSSVAGGAASLGCTGVNFGCGGPGGRVGFGGAGGAGSQGTFDSFTGMNAPFGADGTNGANGMPTLRAANGTVQPAGTSAYPDCNPVACLGSVAPVAVADSYPRVASTASTVVAAPGVLSNDTDANGDTLTAIKVGDPAHGTVILDPNGSFRYTPAAGYSGPDSFTYQAFDGTSRSQIATVAVYTNGSPVPGSDTYVATPGVPLTIAVAAGVLSNDTDPDGDALTSTLLTAPTQGAVSLGSNGSFTYSSAPTATGTDRFAYYLSDGLNQVAGFATITFSTPNRPPVSRDDSYPRARAGTATSTGAPGVLSNDTDPDGDALTAIKLADPAHGTVTLSANGAFVYTPTAGYSGADTFTYRASDGATTSATATVRVSTNGRPTAVADSYSTVAGSTLNVPVATGLRANDTDPDGDTLLTGIGSANVLPAHGGLTLLPDGSFTYVPNAGYSGPDTFTYLVSDGFDSATGTVDLTVTAANRAPTAVADTSPRARAGTPTSVAAPGVLGNDSDPDGNALTAIKVADPAHGTVALALDGSFTYTPTPGYSGPDSFSYRASDGALQSAVTTVGLSTNGAPVVRADSYGTAAATPLVVTAATGLLRNDSDPDADGITAAIGTGPTRGTVTLAADGSFTYTPTAELSGPDSFTYRASDGLDSTVGTVTVTVAAPPSGAPYAPFASWAALVTRQFVDLTGRPPTSAQLSIWVGQLAAGNRVKGDLVASLRLSADNVLNVDPVARLLLATTGATPTAADLSLWIGRARSGTWSIVRIADALAAGPAFQSRYGALGNRQFAERIIADLQGRPARAVEVAAITFSLDRRILTRGQVVLGITETTDYRRVRADVVDVTVVTWSLLGRAPTSSEVTAWGTRRRAGITVATLSGDILSSVEYALRTSQ